jgi:hypothetical protein
MAQPFENLPEQLYATWIPVQKVNGKKKMAIRPFDFQTIN